MRPTAHGKGIVRRKAPGKKMYTDFYGFSKEPFDQDSDSRSFFFSRSHRDALKSLAGELAGGRGFILLTGEKGTGKTFFIEKLLQTLDPAIHAVSIDRNPGSFPQLLEAISPGLKLPVRMRDRKALRRYFLSHILREAAQGKKTVAIMDNAQELGEEFLGESARLWRPGVGGLQLVLVGRPEAEDKLNSWPLRHLKKRIILRCRLSPLTGEESLRYIEHRLRHAGGEVSNAFEPEALSLICRYSGGIPQAINNLCTRALKAGDSLSKKPVDSRLVIEILEDSGILALPEPAGPSFVKRLKARLFPRRARKLLFSKTLLDIQKYLYGEVYGFPRNPFDGQPDLGFYFATENCREVWNSTIYAIRQRKGFILLTGESGVGKTTLIALIDLYLSTRGQETVIPLFHPPNGIGDILPALLQSLGLPAIEENSASTLSRVTGELIRRSLRGEVVALLFDEAQDLKKETVEEILVWTGSNPAIRRVLQLIFIGDRKLERRLKSKEWSALNQKFAARSRLRPLTVQESRDYVEHRIHRAGGNALQVLTPKALTLIAYHAKGIPRVLNRVCYEALAVGYSQLKNKVDAECVRNALAKIEREKREKSKKPLNRPPGSKEYLLSAGGTLPR
jgi:general secretion pathway protein A